MATNNSIDSQQALGSGSSPTFNGLNLSVLSGSAGLVASDASKNITSTISGLSPSMTGLTLSGLTASRVTITNGSKALASSNIATTFSFGSPAIPSLDTNSDTGLTVLSSGSTHNAQISVADGAMGNFITLWSGYSGNQNPTIIWSNTNPLRFGAATTGGLTSAGYSTLVTFSTAGDINIVGSLDITAPGKTVKIARGSNACSGTGATLSGGTVTVSTTAVATGDIVLLSMTASGGTVGFPAISINNGVSFTITSSSVIDTSTYSWVIIKAG